MSETFIDDKDINLFDICGTLAVAKGPFGVELGATVAAL